MITPPPPLSLLLKLHGKVDEHVNHVNNVNNVNHTFDLNAIESPPYIIVNLENEKNDFKIRWELIPLTIELTNIKIIKITHV